MKRLWIAIGILLIVVAACIGTLLWQVSEIDRLSTALSTTENAVRQQQKDAQKTVEQFSKECTAFVERCAAFCHHADCLPLEESAAKMPLLLRQKSYDQFFVEAARCRFYLQELRRGEIPFLNNIF